MASVGEMCEKDIPWKHLKFVSDMCLKSIQIWGRKFQGNWGSVLKLKTNEKYSFLSYISEERIIQVWVLFAFIPNCFATVKADVN